MSDPASRQPPNSEVSGWHYVSSPPHNPNDTTPMQWIGQQSDKAGGYWSCGLRDDHRWLPIADAPRDGTEILVTDAKRKYVVVRQVSWSAAPCFDTHPWQSTEDGGMHYAAKDCTHYMPLPPPPEPKS